MIPALLLCALAALPAAAERRYRVEIGGEHVGFAALRLRCGALGCSATWEAKLRAPADAGGGTIESRVELDTAPDGRARRVRSWRRDGRGERSAEAGEGPVPATLAELLLSAAGPGERRCLPVRDEASGAVGEACATRDGDWLEGEVLGARERFRAAPGQLAEQVILPEQRVQYLADPAADLPCRAPRLFGVAVRAGPGARAVRATRFCGVPAEPSPAPPGDGRGLPPPEAPGQSCREQTAAWLARLRQQGGEGRHVVGVAWDGSAFVWHEWAEARTAAGWVAVDPAFRQAPAQGPRFALARFADGDAAAEAEAGRRVLACWGVGRLE